MLEWSDASFSSRPCHFHRLCHWSFGFYQGLDECILEPHLDLVVVFIFIWIQYVVVLKLMVIFWHFFYTLICFKILFKNVWTCCYLIWRTQKKTMTKKLCAQKLHTFLLNTSYCECISVQCAFMLRSSQYCVLFALKTVQKVSGAFK